jgi:hypothetical protein
MPDCLVRNRRLGGDGLTQNERFTSCTLSDNKRTLDRPEGLDGCAFQSTLKAIFDFF